MKYIIASLLVAISLSIPVAVYGGGDVPVWEEVSRRPASEKELAQQQDAVEVVVHDGAVYITTSHPVKIEVFSILGQLIASKRVPEGTVRLNLKQKGVYILKAGTITKRINL